MDALAIIYDHYRRGSRLADILLTHGQQVRDKALMVAEQVANLRPDTAFIAQAALLHDIGIYRTQAPAIHCHGTQPYVCHGVVGREILTQYHLTAHALVCERHVGVGLTKADIQTQGLPLPLRDMQPKTLEEIIICYADKFYAKTNGRREQPLAAVIAELARFGQDKVDRFMTWHRQFCGATLANRKELGYE